MIKGLISIIIPCYNDAQYIEQSVHSALNQTYPFKEIIIVDDGSDIETKEVLKKLEPQVTKLITQENKGQSTARNVGMKFAKGNFILVLDSDDYFEPSFCEEAVKVLSSDNTIKIVTSHLRRFIGNRTIDVFVPSGGGIATFILENGATGSAMFRKSEALAIGGYDEQMRTGFEDWEFYIRLLKRGGKAFVIQEQLFNYRIRNFSTTTIANKNKYSLLKYIYLKHKELYKENFDVVIIHLLEIADINKKNELKRIKSIDFKLGNFLLKPIRFIKKI